MALKRSYDLLKEFSYFNKEKNSKEQYGDSYTDFGKICSILFKKGITVKSEEEFNRIGILFMIIHKVTRLSKAVFLDKSLFEKPFDNAKDLSIYAAMLAELFLRDKKWEEKLFV